MSIPPRPDFDQGYEAPGARGPIVPPASSFSEYEEPVPEESQTPRELAPPMLYEEPSDAQPEPEPEPEPEFAPVPEAEIEPEPEPEPEPEAVSEPEPVAEPQPAPAAQPAPVPEPDSAADERKSTPPAPASAPRSRPEPEPSSRAQPGSAGRYSWVIQVASLREHQRAYKLVQDLRAKGFPAYLEEAEVREKLWHRVRVGPEIDRKRIESMAASLEAKTGLNVQIQRFP